MSDSKAQSAGDDASSTRQLGVRRADARASGTGIEALAGLAVFLSFTALSLFFLLKDGPVIRALGRVATWASRPPLGADRSRGRTLQSLRGYFVGVTAVAAFNGIVIGLGALGARRVGAVGRSRW